MFKGIDIGYGSDLGGERCKIYLVVITCSCVTAGDQHRRSKSI